MDRLGGRQASFNAASRDQWDAFAEHRNRLTGLLVGGSGVGVGGSRLCVLGAGNANDLDLPSLLAAYREVHLVDIDGEAPALGVARQGVAGHPGLRLHGGLDVTATLGVVAGWTPASALTPPEIAALAEWPASRVAPVLPGRFDRVASPCLLSQILETAAHALGRGHRHLAAVESALIAGHLRLLTRLLAPGGEAVLATEVVSSATLLGLAEWPDDRLAGLLSGLRRSGNHFRGVHPRELLDALRADPTIGQSVAATTPAPWRWRLHDRTYLVSGLAFRVGPGLGR